MQNLRRMKPFVLLVIVVVMVTVFISVVRFGWRYNDIHTVIISRLETGLESKDKPSNTTQSGIIATVSNIDPKKAALENRDKLHLVVMFYNLLDADWRAKHFKYDNASWDARMREISDCIKQNLNHSMVATVHYIYHNVTTLNTYLDGLDLPHREKLFVHEANVITVGGFMRFASDNLQDRVVMFLNSDGFLGEGFDKIDFPYMRKTHVAYALTRHWVACTGGGSCHDGVKYQGSHDGYLFYVGQKLPEPFYAEIDISPSHWGIESVVMGAFHHILKYKVLNPCKILKLMHHHCSGVRPGDSLSLRLARKPRDTLAPFSGLYIK